MMSRFRQAVEAKEFLVTAEVTPPKGGNPERMLQVAQSLKGRVHAVNITDGSRAVLRMSPLAASAVLLRHEIEPVCQVACRDRNLLGIQGDLMGAQALGIRNILALTGDPVKAGESVRLLKLIAKLNAGTDFNDKPLPDGALELFAGAAVDPQSDSWSGLQKRFKRKVEAGAQFFQSQMLTDFDRLEKFMNEVASSVNRPILAGIFLFKSAKNARFIQKYVPGVHVPEEIIQRLDRAKDPLQEGIKIAAEQVQTARELCQGVHMMAIKKEEVIPEILDLAGVQPVEDVKLPTAAQVR